eukprot:1160423-Pelagomonas_calceolata.AAC.3
MTALDHTSPTRSSVRCSFGLTGLMGNKISGSLLQEQMRMKPHCGMKSNSMRHIQVPIRGDGLP